MNKLKIKLLFSFLVILSLTIILYEFINEKEKTKYSIKDTNFYLKILDYKIDGDLLILEAKSKEKLLIRYYIKTKKEKEKIVKNIKVGDFWKVKGNLQKPEKNTNFYSFNYKNYLLSKQIKWILNAKNIFFLKHTSNPFYSFKNHIIKRIDKIDNDYLSLFILGKNVLDKEIKNSYSNNGISHLFAISGMHISLLTILLNKILKTIIKNKKIIFLIISFFLFLFMFLTGFTPSVLRAGSIYILNNIRKTNSLKNLILILIILLIKNPYYIYNLGFVFSFTISSFLIYFNYLLENQNKYFKKLLITSSIAFLAGLPILIYQFHEVNFISILLNLFFVPFVSFIIFPISILTFLIPNLSKILEIVICVLEKASLIINKLDFLTLTFKHTNIIIIIIYYVIIFVILKYKKKYLIILIFMIIIHHNINFFHNNLIVSMIYIGQGDSILIKLPNNHGTILLDTGGKLLYKKEKWKIKKNQYNYSENTIIPYLKSEGISKLGYLILTHGDYDHMGETINLINKFKVENVIFNCGEYNDLEKELIRVLDKKDIKYYSCINELNINKYKLQFLNTKEYDNENDNSNVIYFKYNNYRFLFMGDAGIEREKDILEKYNLKDIYFLKVGHHGSNTSSSQYFIDAINSKYSLISVGKNNRYGHPKDSVLDNLSNSRIYRTDLDGSVEIKLNKKGYKIKTCNP